MPIAPYNPGGYYPFTYGAAAPTSGGAGGQPSSPPDFTTDPNGISTYSPAWYAAHQNRPLGNNVPITVVAQNSQQPQNLTGASPANYSPTAGGIPQVPNPGATEQQALQGNLASLGLLGQLSTGVGGINAGLGALPYNQNLPNYQKLLGQASSNALSNLSGIIPGDVSNQIAQSAAERGVAIGSPGSPNANAGLLRALGLTSLGLQQTGLNQFGSLMNMTPTGPQFNPASMFIDPNVVQLAQTAANLYNAAPIPQYAQNAAMNALSRGIGQGQRATGPQGGGGIQQPTQSQDLVSEILNRYGPTVGTPSPGAPPPSQYYQGMSPGDSAQYDQFWDSGQNIPGNTVDLNLDPSAPSSENINLDELYPSFDPGSFDFSENYYG